MANSPSLLSFNLFPPAERIFQDVYKAIPTRQGIYFQARERIFLLTPNGTGWTSKSWAPQTAFGQFFLVGDQFFTNQTSLGFFRLRDNRWEQIPIPGWQNSANFAVNLALPLNNPDGANPGGSILIGLRNGTLYSLSGSTLKPFSTDAQSILNQHRISTGNVVPGLGFAIGTRSEGLVLIDAAGKLLYRFNRLSGLPTDGVLNSLVDATGSLWLALQNGIARIELNSPFTEFTNINGISAATNDILRVKGTVYAGSVNGLLELNSKTGQFRQIEGKTISSAWGLLERNGRLLFTAGREGTFELYQGKLRLISAPTLQTAFYGIAPSRRFPDRIWLLTDAGLGCLRELAPGQYQDEGILAKFNSIRTLWESPAGEVWAGSESMGVARVTFPGNTPASAKLDSYGKAQGLTSDGGADVIELDGHFLAITTNGASEFNAATNRFVPSRFKDLAIGAETGSARVAQDQQGNTWVYLGLRPFQLLRKPDGSVAVDDRKLRRIPEGAVSIIAADADGILWLGGADRIYRYDPRHNSTKATPVPPILRLVRSGDNERRLPLSIAPNGSSPQVPFADNSLRFEYALPSFENSETNEFSTQLAGFDSAFSHWSQDTRRDYTNLPPGSYRFLIKARNYRQEESPTIAEYRFEVLPPWYRTSIAYLAYALLLGATGYVVYRVTRARLLARERSASQARLVQAELERTRNIELLSEIGKDITSSLEIDTIFGKLYQSVNQLMDATIFGVGIYHPAEHAILYRLAFEEGKRYPPYRRDTTNKNQFPVWCLDHRQPVFINDVSTEYSRYIQSFDDKPTTLEDGTTTRLPSSLIYLPLIVKDTPRGILTVQSFSKNAYTNYHLNLLENLAAYTAIALDNADAYEGLKSAQDQLVVQEKLASLGALTAGIAHEIKNPLNFVNNFADLSVELMEELRQELTPHQASFSEKDWDNIQALLDDLTSNARKINEHGKRADGIVRSMLLHSRGQSSEAQLTDINAMLEEYVNLAYHGMRAQDSSFNVTIERHLHPDTGSVFAIAQDLGRVFLNIINNACYAANEKAKLLIPGYQPTLTISSHPSGSYVEVRIRDNGTGIPDSVREKIFNPFFTTKPTGQGTGLGLSISHDIVVRQHAGQLEVLTEPGEFTEFLIRIPRQRSTPA